MYALRAVVLITDNNRQLPSTTDNYRQQADNYRQQAHNYRQQAVNYRQEAEINCVGSAICLTHRTRPSVSFHFLTNTTYILSTKAK